MQTTSQSTIRSIVNFVSHTDIRRAITILQTLYFVVTTITRFAQGLAVTTLELTVLGFIFCTLFIYGLWWHKPVDVSAGEVFPLKPGVTIAQILMEAGEIAEDIYRDTPMDFLREEWLASRLWIYCVNILRQMHLFPDVHLSRPLQRLPSLYFPILSRRSQLALFAVTCIYTATFFGAWNFDFPTYGELMAWRVIACIQSAIVLVAAAIELPLQDRRVGPLDRTASIDPSRMEKSLKRQPRQQSSSFWSKPVNNTICRPRALDIQMRSLFVMMPVCAAYSLCRMYIVAEDLVGLRSLPPTALQDVDWLRYWPGLWG